MENLPNEEEALLQDQERIAGYFRLAFERVGAELGGQDLVDRIGSLPTDTESAWPANALRYIEDLHPGSAEVVFATAETIQSEAHALEM